MRTYATPVAFKEALEARLKQRAQQTRRDLNNVRLRLLLERFAVRVSLEYGDAVVLKGGVVVELRLAHARTTRDLDLRLLGTPGDTLDRLRRAGRRDLGEHLQFEVQRDPRHPTIEAEGMQYEGLRFRVQARLAGKVYGAPFGVDAAFAEPITGQPEVIEGSDLLAFVGISAPELRVYPLETHIAEKLHAYTVPRARPNSRVKDLPDLALLSQARPIQATDLRDAISQTFAHRVSHSVPERLPPPPERWALPYARLAQRDRLPWPDLDAVHAAATAFLDPVLAGTTGRWRPDEGAWGVDPTG